MALASIFIEWPQLHKRWRGVDWFFSDIVLFACYFLTVNVYGKCEKAIAFVKKGLEAKIRSD